MLGVLIESADIIHFMDNKKSHIASRVKNAVKPRKIQAVFVENRNWGSYHLDFITNLPRQPIYRERTGHPPSVNRNLTDICSATNPYN